MTDLVNGSRETALLQNRIKVLEKKIESLQAFEDQRVTFGQAAKEMWASVVAFAAVSGYTKEEVATTETLQKLAVTAFIRAKDGRARLPEGIQLPRVVDVELILPDHISLKGE